MLRTVSDGLAVPGLAWASQSTPEVKHCLPAHEFDVKDLKKRIVEIDDHHQQRLNEMVAVSTAEGLRRGKWPAR